MLSIGFSWTATVGGRVGQEDMLAVSPSAYPDDTILDVFTYNGAPAANNHSPGHLNAFALSGYWQPQNSGWFPSISAGWGYNAYDYGQSVPTGSLKDSQSWYVGLQWLKAFSEVNSMGLAFGQPVFATGLTGGQSPNYGNDAFELWYKIQATDHIAVTPSICYLSRPAGQFTPAGQSFDNLGALVKTTFKF